MNLKMLFAKWWQYCLSLNVLTHCGLVTPYACCLTAPITVTSLWARWHCKSASPLFTQLCIQAQIKKHQSSTSLPFVRGIHRGLINSPHKWPVTRKMFPFDDFIMTKPLPKSRLNYHQRGSVACTLSHISGSGDEYNPLDKLQKTKYLIPVHCWSYKQTSMC